MAALEKTGSRAGSLSLENEQENASSQTHLLTNHQQNGEVDHTSLANLARRNTMRKRSFRNNKKGLHGDTSHHGSMESLTGDDGHLHPSRAYNGHGHGHRRSPSLRTPSPGGRHHMHHHDVGFSDTVSNVVEIVKEEHRRGRPYGPYGNRFARGYPPTHHAGQHSYPVLMARRGGGRRLPPTPNKPSTLKLQPSNINFPKLNASPTRMATSRHPAHTLPHSRDDRYLRGDPREMYYRDRERRPYRDYGHHQQYEFRDHEREAYEREREIERELELDYERMEHAVPLSYEQALSMGRTGRVFGSPVLINGGYKSKGMHARHSDSDDEDWC